MGRENHRERHQKTTISVIGRAGHDKISNRQFYGWPNWPGGWGLCDGGRRKSSELAGIFYKTPKFFVSCYGSMSYMLLKPRFQFYASEYLTICLLLMLHQACTYVERLVLYQPFMAAKHRLALVPLSGTRSAVKTMHIECASLNGFRRRRAQSANKTKKFNKTNTKTDENINESTTDCRVCGHGARCGCEYAYRPRHR